MNHAYSPFTNQLQLQFTAEDSLHHDSTIEVYHRHQTHEQPQEIRLYPSEVPAYYSSYDSGAVPSLPASPAGQGTSTVPIGHTSAPTSPATTSRTQRRLSSSSTPPRYDLDLEEIDDPEPIPPLPPNASEEQKKAWIKKRNTRSAKLSRLRKALYTKRLEKELESLKREKEMWHIRAQTLRQLLISHGISYPPFEDARRR